MLTMESVGVDFVAESNDSSLLEGSESWTFEIMDNISSSISSKELNTMLDSTVDSLVCISLACSKYSGM